MENNKGQTIFLSVIGVATLLVAIIGATFAYFTASVSGNDKASSIIVNTATIASINFTDGATITLSNAMPGANANKEFTVALAGDATTTVAMTYRVLLNYTNSGITDLKLNTTAPTGASLSSAITNNINGNIGQASGSKIELGTGTFAIGATGDARTHTWNVEITFPETGADQNSQQGKNFNGFLQVEFAGGNNIYYNDANQGGTSAIPTAQ